MAEHDLCRQHAAPHDPAIAVDVGEHQVEQMQPLAQPGDEVIPVGSIHDHRQRVERPVATLSAGPAAAVGDAVVLGVPVGQGRPATQPGQPQLVDRLPDSVLCGADAGSVDKFVAARPGTAGEPDPVGLEESPGHGCGHSRRP